MKSRNQAKLGLITSELYLPLKYFLRLRKSVFLNNKIHTHIFTSDSKLLNVLNFQHLITLVFCPLPKAERECGMEWNNRISLYSGGSVLKNSPENTKTWVQPLGREDPLEKEMATHSSIHGNPLQYSCLETPMDRGAWRAIDHGVAKSQTPLEHIHMYVAQTTGAPPRRRGQDSQFSPLQFSFKVFWLQTVCFTVFPKCNPVGVLTHHTGSDL